MNNKGELIALAKRVWKKYEIKVFWFKKQTFWVLRDLSLEIFKGEVVVLLGESGCGKSTLGRLFLQLEKPEKGEILWFGKRLQALFQDNYASLNPRFKIKTLLEEPYLLNFPPRKKEFAKKIKEILEKVGLEEEYLDRYPHQLSGGERQRVALARALITQPDLVVLDEPTSSLDVTIQNQILLLLKELQREYNLSYLLITHSIPVALEMATRIVVMYLGKIVEIFNRDEWGKIIPHPYTDLLFKSYPNPFSDSPPKFNEIKGEPPSLLNLPSGCEFHPRCPLTIKECTFLSPPLKEISPGHFIACLLRS